MTKDRDLRTLAADSNDWQGALSKARDERDEARALARRCFHGLGTTEGSDLWWELDEIGPDWLKAAEPTAEPAEGRE